MTTALLETRCRDCDRVCPWHAGTFLWGKRFHWLGGTCAEWQLYFKTTVNSQDNKKTDKVKTDAACFSRPLGYILCDLMFCKFLPNIKEKNLLYFDS